jgi:hypothetical protein
VVALLTGAGTVGAQTVITQQPYETDAVVGQPLESVQRTTVYRTIEPRGRGRAPIVRERVVTERFAPAPVTRQRVIAPADDTGYAYSGRGYAYPADAAYSYAYVPPAANGSYVSTQSPGPQYVYEVDDDNRDIANCERRFRSYDPASRTFLGYDGLRHSCP